MQARRSKQKVSKAQTDQSSHKPGLFVIQYADGQEAMAMSESNWAGVKHYLGRSNSLPTGVSWPTEDNVRGYLDSWIWMIRLANCDAIKTSTVHDILYLYYFSVDLGILFLIGENKHN